MRCGFVILQETKASENDAADEDSANTETGSEPWTPESVDSNKISELLGTNEDSPSGFKVMSSCKSVQCASKASSRAIVWSPMLVLSVSLVAAAVFIANICGVIEF